MSRNKEWMECKVCYKGSKNKVRQWMDDEVVIVVLATEFKEKPFKYSC